MYICAKKYCKMYSPKKNRMNQPVKTLNTAKNKSWFRHLNWKSLTSNLSKHAHPKTNHYIRCFGPLGLDSWNSAMKGILSMWYPQESKPPGNISLVSCTLDLPRFEAGFNPFHPRKMGSWSEKTPTMIRTMKSWDQTFGLYQPEKQHLLIITRNSVIQH